MKSKKDKSHVTSSVHLSPTQETVDRKKQEEIPKLQVDPHTELFRFELGSEL
jgi:hypothetical protein